jgi:hypothetical protein
VNTLKLSAQIPGYFSILNDWQIFDLKNLLLANVLAQKFCKSHLRMVSSFSFSFFFIIGFHICLQTFSVPNTPIDIKWLSRKKQMCLRFLFFFKKKKKKKKKRNNSDNLERRVFCNVSFLENRLVIQKMAEIYNRE